MPTPAIFLTGDEVLDKELKDLEPKLQKKAIRRATREAAKGVLDEAKRLVPHDTGQLERSLVVRAAKGRGGKRLPRHTTGHSVSTREGLFSGEQFYGGFVEFGTRKMEADSFLRPALYGHETQTLNDFRRHLGRALAEIGRPG